MTTRPAAGVKAGPGFAQPSPDGADAAPDEAKARSLSAPAPAAFHPLTPQQLAALSWHQRQKYQARLEAHYRELDRVVTRNALRRAAALLDEALTENHRRNEAPCGTVSAYNRHKRRKEPIDPLCREADRAYRRRRNTTRKATAA